MSDLPTIDTPREPVTTTYHGVDVTDDYRWLEDASDGRTRSWTAAQDARTHDYLASLPSRERIRKSVEDVLTVRSTTYARLRGGGSTYFALKVQPPRQQPFLVVLPTLDDLKSEQVLVDPNDLDAGGATSIDWFVPSPDGSLVAVSLSERGTEDGTLHVYDAGSGRPVDVPVPLVNSGTAGGSLAWRTDSRGFWYTRHPAPGTVADADLGFFQEVWFRELGTPAADDRAELSGKVFTEPRIAESFLVASGDGRWVMDRVQRGDGGEWQIFVRPQGGGEWQLVADLDDRCTDAVFGPDSLFLVSVRNDPRGQVLRLALPPAPGPRSDDQQTGDRPVVVVPAGETTVAGLAVTDARLWVVGMDGGPSSLRAFDHAGTPLGPVDVPPVSSVGSLVRLGADEVAWAVESFVSPRSWWVHDDQDAAPRRTALDTVTSVDFSGFEVQRVFATSKDGTQVPVNLIGRPDLLRGGGAPALLTGYGGYGVSAAPSFQPTRLVWLREGGIFAVANIRGGGEYGEEWHQAGRLAAKQNCFDDFIACADHLVATGVTTRDRLAILGGSNGGLLMGAVLTQRPDIAAAVLCLVPVLDALRSETTSNGAFNVTEFGSVQDEAMFRALHAYSPYHNVRDGTAYPPVLCTAGAFDPRVDAWHAKKMVARLQAATASDQPVLLRMEAGGHGIGQSLDQLVGLWTDLYAFVVDRLHLDDRGDPRMTT
jgi:prolyl oligopeptidase